MNNLGLKGSFSDQHWAVKSLLGLGITGIIFALSNLLAYSLQECITDKAMELRINQGQSAFLLFIVCPLACYYLFSRGTVTEKLGLKNKPTAKTVLLTILSMLFTVSITGILAKINQEMVLPECLAELEQQLKATEDELAKLTVLILDTDNVGVIFLNIIIICLIPAIGEELIFRVFIQGGLQKRMSAFASIVVTSVIFSAIHFQFYGFLPRFALSLWLGVLYYWGRSTYLNSLAHFTNNLLAVLSFIAMKAITGKTPDLNEVESMGSDTLFASFIIICIFASIVYAIWKSTRRNEELEQKSDEITELAEED